MIEYTGSCVCGNISYKVHKLKSIWYCHCNQCRTMTGNFMAASQAQLKDISIKGEPKWFYVSDKAKHGFCPECGSQLFWQNDKNDYFSICVGSLHDSKSLAAKGHVFVSEKAHYYQIKDDLPQYSTWWPE